MSVHNWRVQQEGLNINCLSSLIGFAWHAGKRDMCVPPLATQQRHLHRLRAPEQ